MAIEYTGKLTVSKRRGAHAVDYSKLLDKMDLSAVACIKGYFACKAWCEGKGRGVMTLIMKPRNSGLVIEVLYDGMTGSVTIWTYDYEFEDCLNWAPKEAIMENISGFFRPVIFDKEEGSYKRLRRLLEKKKNVL